METLTKAKTLYIMKSGDAHACKFLSLASKTARKDEKRAGEIKTERENT